MMHELSLPLYFCIDYLLNIEITINNKMDSLYLNLNVTCEEEAINCLR